MTTNFIIVVLCLHCTCTVKLSVIRCYILVISIHEHAYNRNITVTYKQLYSCYKHVYN